MPFNFGASGDSLTPGDYDGNGLFDTAEFRPSTGECPVQRSTVGKLIANFCGADDRPVPNAFEP